MDIDSDHQLENAVNRSAKFHPVSGPDELPAIEVAGVLVFLYVQDGYVHVSVDLDTASAALLHGPDKLVPLQINVQGGTVFATGTEGHPAQQLR